ncbi:MAG TPA: hypothetical protein VN715_21165 [Roseiarcus sp.]|nr:hypothetical protein [Roseiarcus sp.]
MSFEKFGIVGAGVMGSEIAPISALSGQSSLLSDEARLPPRPLPRRMVAGGANDRRAGRGSHRHDSYGRRL